MGLFGKIVATAINVATLPIAIAKDVVTLGNCANAGSRYHQTYTVQKLQQIKDDVV